MRALAIAAALMALAVFQGVAVSHVVGGLVNPLFNSVAAALDQVNR